MSLCVWLLICCLIATVIAPTRAEPLKRVVIQIDMDTVDDSFWPTRFFSIEDHFRSFYQHDSTKLTSQLSFVASSALPGLGVWSLPAGSTDHDVQRVLDELKLEYGITYAEEDWLSFATSAFFA